MTTQQEMLLLQQLASEEDASQCPAKAQSLPLDQQAQFYNQCVLLSSHGELQPNQVDPGVGAAFILAAFVLAVVLVIVGAR